MTGYIMMKQALISGTLLCLTACASGSGIKQSYLIGSTLSAATPINAPSSLRLVGIDNVRLPAYAQSLKISTLGQNMVTQDSNNMWAEPPEEAIQRSLAVGLEQALGTDVLASPYPRGMKADRRVQVRFDQFAKTATGAKISGQYIITDGRGRDIRKIKGFDYSRSSGTDYAGFVSAVDAALAQLSTEIAGTLAGHQS